MKNLNRPLQFACLFSIIFFAISCTNDSEEDLTIDCSIANLILSVDGTTDASCDTGGTITVSSTGGEGAIEYSIDGTVFQTATTFTDVDNGTYTVTARDSNLCTSTASATVAVVGDQVTFSTSTTNSGCGTAQGSITVNASGGDTNYQYSINGGAFGSSNTFSDLARGSYTVEVMDGGSCNESKSVAVASGTSYNTDIKPIIENSCAVSGCHVAGTGRTNFTVFSTVQSNSAGIKSRTQSGNMPATGSITQAEKDLIACWVDDGALNN